MTIFASVGSYLTYCLLYVEGRVLNCLGALMCGAIVYSFYRDWDCCRIRVFPYFDEPLEADTFLHGHALARNWGRLEDLSRKNHLPSLSRFGFADPLRGEERKWWSAKEGVTSVQGLLRAVRAAPHLFDDAAQVCDDLERLERAFVLAHTRGARFALLVEVGNGTNSLAWEQRGGYP